MDEEMVRALINRCDHNAGQLETLFRQDAREMEDCTRGEILTAYQKAMDKGAEQTKEIRRLLWELYNDYGIIR